MLFSTISIRMILNDIPISYVCRKIQHARFHEFYFSKYYPLGMNITFIDCILVSNRFLYYMAVSGAYIYIVGYHTCAMQLFTSSIPRYKIFFSLIDDFLNTNTI